MLIVRAGNNTILQYTTDMIVLAFFFLLRPGEYTDLASDNTPFTINDAQLFIGSKRIEIETSSILDI